jgi:hypothetical protein
MQRAADAIGVHKFNVGAAPAGIHEDAADVAEALEDGAEVGLEGVGRQAYERDRPRRRGVPVFVRLLL